MNIPVIMLCDSYLHCLGYSLKQVKVSNPNSTIHLIGSKDNDVFDFVEHHLISNYNQTAIEFEKIYKHMDDPGRTHVFRNIKLYAFVLNEFIRAHNISKFLLIDIDLMIYCNIEKEFKRLKEWDFSLGYTSREHLSMCPVPMFCNNVSAINEFCKFVTNIYSGRDPENFNKLVEYYKSQRAQGIPGGVCVMTLYALFAKTSGFRVYYVDEVVEDSTHELNINIPRGGKYNYQMLTGPAYLKKIEWINKIPYGFDSKTGKRIRFKSVHFAGGAKREMKWYCW